MQETQGEKRIKSLPPKPETVTAVRNETVQADTVATDDALSKTIQQDNETVRTQGITTAIINLRNEPGLDGHVIRVLKKGIPLTIIGKSGNWYQIPTGYIYADSVLITNN
ncbi:SH3 domain-containing protein [uncultured Desulfobacter sp.]|uniref:SH3 domain-containing protein n=1 Tax=uncultured Desulfobacter sp. TaxID=240139 RepID=UPI002AA8DD66|nr:SH3 domain-containing protein [uncultured Desulfobacter sp.]